MFRPLATFGAVASCSNAAAGPCGWHGYFDLPAMPLSDELPVCEAD
jgi:hypothetical protein